VGREKAKEGLFRDKSASNSVLSPFFAVFSRQTMFERKKPCSTGWNIV
jgi:hypothetical protein